MSYLTWSLKFHRAVKAECTFLPCLIQRRGSQFSDGLVASDECQGTTS